jgi:hypothetical protein
LSVRPHGRPGRPVLERVLDVPEAALLWLPWPSTPRIVLEGSFAFLKQILRSRSLGLGPGGTAREPLTGPTVGGVP